MPYGVTTTGFVPKTTQDIKAELEAALKADFGDSIDLSPESNFGQLVGVMAERYADLWALAQAVYAAFTPDSSTGLALDNVAAISGTVREPARKSGAVITATGTPGTLLSEGRMVSVSGTGARFATVFDVVINALTAWAPGTLYGTGAQVTNGGKVYHAVTGGTSAGGGGGPTGTGTTISDNTVVWRFIGNGTGAMTVFAEAVETGPKVAAAWTLTVIETPVSGWSSVTNVLDAELGSDVETDAALRIRREDELRASGRSPVDSIRAQLLQVDQVTAATVFDNPADMTDVNGLPPHSVEALVQGGSDGAVAQRLWESVSAGVATYGTTSTLVTDSQGIDHTVSFSRPTPLSVSIALAVTVDPHDWPADGEEQVKAKIVEWGDAQRAGKDIVAAAIAAQAFKIPGVLDVPGMSISLPDGTSGSPNITVTARELAVYDTSRITVAVTEGVP